MAEPSSTQSCCPERSEPALQTDYVPKGTESKLDDLPIYTVGQGDKAIVFIYDIFGFNGGRTRQMCDQFAAEGYFVILPDFFRGESWDERNGLAFEKIMPWISKFSWDVIKGDLEKRVYPYLDSKGIKKIGMTGCCFGGGMTMLASADERINCGVPFHAVINVQMAEQIANNIKSPQCLIAAGNDAPEIKEGGIVEKVLKAKPFGDKVIVKDFPDMIHGWVPRASFDVPENVRDVNAAMEMAIDFFKKNL